jgi:hypothetical protein
MFEAILSGKKNFEFRLNDFDVSEGDSLTLEEFDPKTQKYSGRKIEKKVTFVGKFDIKNTYWPKEQILEKGIQIISLQ